MSHRIAARADEHARKSERAPFPAAALRFSTDEAQQSGYQKLVDAFFRPEASSGWLRVAVQGHPPCLSSQAACSTRPVPFLLTHLLRQRDRFHAQISVALLVALLSAGGRRRPPRLLWLPLPHSRGQSPSLPPPAPPTPPS